MPTLDEILANFSNDPFDPEGEDYDYLTAILAGLTPNKSGHWPSFDPNTGMLLKGIKHPTIGLTFKDQARLNYQFERRNGRYFYKAVPFSFSRRP